MEGQPTVFLPWTILSLQRCASSAVTRETRASARLICRYEAIIELLVILLFHQFLLY